MIKHKKRGSVYEVLVRGKMQNANTSIDGKAATAYVGKDGSVWFRLDSEILDGRFSNASGSRDAVDDDLDVGMLQSLVRTLIEIKKRDAIGDDSSAESSEPDAGIKFFNATRLPDGSGFLTDIFPLPKNHWLFQTDAEGYCGPPPMKLRMRRDSPSYMRIKTAVEEAAKYAVRASTRCGKENDFDPDALVGNMIIGLLGYYTSDGADQEVCANPDPIPPLFEPNSPLPTETPKPAYEQVILVWNRDRRFRMSFIVESEADAERARQFAYSIGGVYMEIPGSGKYIHTKP